MAIVKLKSGKYKNTNTGSYGDTKDSVRGSTNSSSSSNSVSPQLKTEAAQAVSKGYVKNEQEYYDAVNRGIANSNAMPGSKKQPVGSLSTSNAMDYVNEAMTKLNMYSPTTAPGYTAPKADETKTNQEKLPKAYFTNEAGQEAEFTDEQLKDKGTIKFLKDNGYFQVRTEGPNFNPMEEVQEEVDAFDNTMEKLAKQFLNYSLDGDPDFAPVVESIKGQYDQLRQETEKANASRMAAEKSRGFRTGSTQYAGAIQSGIEGEELRQANDRIAELNQDELAAITAARTSYKASKYTEFTQKVAIIEKLREKKAEVLDNYTKTLSARLKEIKEENKEYEKQLIQASRDKAISDIVAQGVTDPRKILDFLNYDDKGNQMGDFTLKEIKTALDVVLPKAKPVSGNKLTLSEARNMGLPLSLVGLNENEIIKSFTSTKAPNWFVQKATAEARKSLTDEQIVRLWEQYRNAFESNKDVVLSDDLNYEEDEDPTSYEKAAETNKEKARDFFKAAYGDAIDEATINTLADYVQMYIAGGMTYAEAIEAVREEAEE